MFWGFQPTPTQLLSPSPRHPPVGLVGWSESRCAPAPPPVGLVGLLIFNRLAMHSE